MAHFNISDGLDFLRGCVVDFDPLSGLSSRAPIIQRHLSQLSGMFADAEAYADLVQRSDPLLYAYHALDIPQTTGDLSFGCSVLYPGKVGNEYFFTKGHYHEKRDIGEVYHCLRGHGYMMLENAQGDWAALEVRAGQVCYVPRFYAHRSINVSPREPFVTLFVYRADAGHDYGTIQTKGFRKLLVEQGGEPVVVDNPNWK